MRPLLGRLFLPARACSATGTAVARFRAQRDRSAVVQPGLHQKRTQPGRLITDTKSHLVAVLSDRSSLVRKVQREIVESKICDQICDNEETDVIEAHQAALLHTGGVTAVTHIRRGAPQLAQPLLSSLDTDAQCSMRSVPTPCICGGILHPPESRALHDWQA